MGPRAVSGNGCVVALGSRIRQEFGCCELVLRALAGGDP
ncbi:hypothetical protein RISK_003282 [Rhodopirellula islandica]|uniref:Uncharacterized protein n=1 Tax=Rhodopirellula islandica TaxID=595434 RepID=A0A0J1BDQ0_RHOIS|nr:hypothetical protein RISK_003282 [Rhodopirellula islandica]